MRSLIQEPKASHLSTSTRSTKPNRACFGRSLEVNSVLHLQRAVGNHTAPQTLQTDAEKPERQFNGTTSRHFGHDISRVPMHPPAAGPIQTKRAIHKPADEYEQEADRVAEQVMRMPEPRLLAQESARLQPKGVGTGDHGQTSAPPIVHEVLRSSGQPLDPQTRAFMQTRFGYDFSRVQVYSGSAAGRSARALNAHAYTVGHKIVFGAGRFAPGTQEGRRLIAHELTHVVQQSGLDGIRVDSRNEIGGLSLISLPSPVHVQRDEIEMTGTDVHPKGLLVPKHVKHVSGRWVDLWRSKKDSTIRILLANMLTIINAELSGLRVAPMVFDQTPSTTEGGFRRQEWRMQINLDIDLHRKVSLDDKAGSLSADELAIIGDTLYHEARHAEQAFLVARKRAATIRDPDALAKTLDMPVSIAKAAIRVGPPGPNDPGDERIEEWAAFEPSGRYFAYWQWNETMKEVTKDILDPIVTRSPSTPDEFSSTADLINRQINILSTKWSFPYDERAKIEKLSAPQTLDTEVLAQLRKITSKFDKLVRAIDDFRVSVELLEGVKSNPDEMKWRILDAASKWTDIRVAQLELFIAQSDAYLAYPMEVDARRAGEAAKGSILVRTRPARPLKHSSR